MIDGTPFLLQAIYWVYRSGWLGAFPDQQAVNIVGCGNSVCFERIQAILLTYRKLYR